MITLLLAATMVYRLELVDEVPYIVGADELRREVVLVEPGEYAILTGRVDRVWKSLNATPSGRTSLHGRIVESREDTEALERVAVYEDGYVYRTRFEKMSGEMRRNPFAKHTEENVKPANISDRQWKYRQMLKAAKNAKPKVVTVERNAATGEEVVK